MCGNIHAFFININVFKQRKNMTKLPIPKIEEPLLDLFIQAHNRVPNNMQELIQFCKKEELV